MGIFEELEAKEAKRKLNDIRKAEKISKFNKKISNSWFNKNVVNRIPINKEWRNSLVCVGLLLFWISNGSYIVSISLNGPIKWILFCVGIILSLIGCYIWTKLKNRYWAFMFWGILTPIGLLGISLLENKSPALTEIMLTPASPVNLPVGCTLQLTAIGKYLNDTTKDINSSVTWSSSNPSVATVNSKGLVTCVGQALFGRDAKNGRFTYYAGDTNITASLDEIQSTPVALTVVRNS
jgi:hypothetical protein